MADEINTRSVAWGFANSDDIVLVTAAKTRTIFRPSIHSGGVRGHVIRQKIGKDGTWADINEVNFNSAPADSGVSIELNTEATRLLFDKLTNLYQVQGQGIGFGDQKYVVGKEDEVLVINDQNKKKVIQEILDKGYSEEFWESLANTNPDLATRLAVAQLQVDRRKVIKEFQAAMRTEASNESFWQSFFEKHPWILQHVFAAPVFMLQGETYLGGKIAKGRGGVGGVATDYLFKDDTTTSFSVIDIKTPHAGIVGSIYRGDKGSGLDNETYSMHNDLSGGIVQVRNQIAVAVENFQSTLGKTFSEINQVHPKGVLLIGDQSRLLEKERDSFNHFRHGEANLTIMTFDELLRKLGILFDVDVSESEDDKSEAIDEIPF